MENKLKIAVVNFHTAWGDKDKNLIEIERLMREAADKGAQLVLFPEMCLSGYDDIRETPKQEKMQTLLAEPIPGPSAIYLKELARSLGIYTVIGMPEAGADGKVYNVQAAFSPDGTIGVYRKMHLPPPEPHWATAGDKPFILETPWGPIGCAICYDVYTFPEVLRYYAAKGCRLILNSTAYAYIHGPIVGPRTLEAYAVTNGIFIASANLVGKDLDNIFYGGSHVLGPTDRSGEICYYCGSNFASRDADNYEIAVAEIDLSLARRMQFVPNPKTGKRDFRPELYIELYSQLID